MTPISRLPLNGLRTFEAAARRGSFLRAAEELNVTPGAVSRQIKALEAELGLRLFERFNRVVGIAPMAYLLAWRMALAKQLLRKKESSVADVAERVGYSSASTFSIAFARHVGQPPMRYARSRG